MIKKKSYNGLLTLGISAIILGLALLFYSITSYSEIRLVTDNIDFDTLDNNNQISANEKYYKYSEIYDTINRELEKNKKLPVKNMSCAYLDYAQHNIKSMHRLVYKNSNEDFARRSIVKKNVKALINTYKYYNTCRKTQLYTDELTKILTESESYENLYTKDKMNTFMNINKDINSNNTDFAVDDKINDEAFSLYEHEITPVNTDENIIQNTPKVINSNNEKNPYKKVQQYIESDGDKDTGTVYYTSSQTSELNTKNNQP